MSGVIVAEQTTDVEHTIQPYIEYLLRDADAVIVSPYMGYKQFESFKGRVLFSLHDGLGVTTLGGAPLWEYIGSVVTAEGYGICVPQRRAIRAYDLWPRARIWVENGEPLGS